MALANRLFSISGLFVLGLLFGCADSQAPGDPSPNSLPSTPFLASDPFIPSPGAPSVSYVSLSPGAFAATAVTLRVARTGATVDIALVNGGFDPVAVQSIAGDTIVAVVQGLPGQSIFAFLVPTSAAPVVVRTSPVDHQLRVSLTDTIVITFSEPMDRATLAGAFALTTGGAPVPGSIRGLPDAGPALRATFVPADTLAPRSTHQIRVGRAARDLAGDSLRAVFLADFSTDSLDTPPPRGPVVSILSPVSGETVPFEFPRIRFLITSDSGLGHLGLLRIDDTGVQPPVEYTGMTGDLSSFLGRLLYFNSYPPWVGPGTHSIMMSATDDKGRIGLSDPLRITFADPDPLPRIQVRSFALIEYTYPEAPEFWFYAPQLLVAEAPGQSGLTIVGSEILDIPGLPLPFPRAFAYALSVPPVGDVDLFPELFGQYVLEAYAADGRRATGPEAILKLTYQDGSGHLYSTTVTGPILPGSLPETYTRVCGHWTGPGIVDYQCPTFVRQESGIQPSIHH